MTGLLPAWRKLRLTVQIETKLNKSCLVHGEVSYILPCLGRIEIDRQNGEPQAVSVEDSTACIHGSRGYAKPASTELRSEPWIVAALAKAVLPPNPKVDWDGWVADYSRIRDAIERTYPEMFKDFNNTDVAARWFPPAAHRPAIASGRPRPAKRTSFRRRRSLPTSKSTRSAATSSSSPRSAARANSTQPSIQYRDRFRGVDGTRMALFMNENDIVRLGLREGDIVSLKTAIGDDAVRRVDGFIVHAYNIPEGCLGGYYPECNPLIPLWHHATGSFVPASKGVPVVVETPGAIR